MTPAARKRQFKKLELKVTFARKGKREAALNVIRAERLADLRAVADRTREGWLPPESAQPDMFAALALAEEARLVELIDHVSTPVRGP